jgi:hypothetical protein
MQKRCSKCGFIFNCTNEQNGCWCEHIQLDTSTLDQLKNEFDNCLCPECLKAYEHKQTGHVVKP